ncbi:unnamed protein product [Rotaria sordida]|uniref:Aminopeptidase n=1 Tax=Rotaria sordida TaxID=392033 RepID=A0A815EGP8_9BILA|nr:unnamed protein product [Rotaria sordida]CAF1306446.1 unnamed protein product [Rotaria sordida]
MTTRTESKKPRARDLGIPFDGVPGKYNAITDVDGIQVGFSTIIEGDSIRTGVTAIFPRRTNSDRSQSPCFANWFSLNGNGEITGIHRLAESGLLTCPILITNTLSVGICRDSLIRWFLQKNQNCPVDALIDVCLPIVAETWDGYLNDYHVFSVKEEHVFEALNNAEKSNGFIREGNIGGGTGMICFGFKGGTGTSSRKVDDLNYTVGVLVQANFGRKKQLIIAGVPVGKEMLEMGMNISAVPDEDAGSLIVILATDAPLLPHQLKRLATRVSLGLGKLGSISGDSSGDIFLAFSTATISNVPMMKTAEFLPNDQMNPLFAATIQCVEEAIVNAMIAAETMVGYNGAQTNNHVEGCHHRLNNDLNNVVHPHFYIFIHVIQNDYAYNLAISSCHLATGILPPRKKLFVNRNARLHNLEERFKHQTLILNEYLEKVMRLI